MEAKRHNHVNGTPPRCFEDYDRQVETAQWSHIEDAYVGPTYIMHPYGASTTKNDGFNDILSPNIVPLNNYSKGT